MIQGMCSMEGFGKVKAGEGIDWDHLRSGMSGYLLLIGINYQF